MDIQLTAVGSGYYRVFVDGGEVSQHTTERECTERAIEEKIANPNADVRYKHDYEVTVRVVVDSLVETPLPPPVEEPPAPPPDPSPSLVFESNWDQAIGATEAALTDGGRWAVQVALDYSDVIDAAGLDFPTKNVLRVAGVDGLRSGEILQKLGLPIPAVGASTWYRWYFRYAALHGVQLTHPIQDGSAVSAANWMFNCTSLGPDTWSPDFNSRAAWPHNRWGTNIVLQKNRTYRFELEIYRASETEYEMHARVYLGKDLLFQDSDFYNVDRSLTLVASPRFPIANLSALGELRCGVNGFTGVPAGYNIHSYQGRFAVSTSGWIGE